MKKFRCTVCGYVHEGDSAPEKCPLCKAPASTFVEVEETVGALTFAISAIVALLAEHYHISFITENPEFYWGTIAPTCLSLIFGLRLDLKIRDLPSITS